MDYELYFTDAQACAKELKEKASAETKTVNKIQKSISNGSINALPKLISALRDATREREDALRRLEAMEFNGQEYMSNGDYAEQMLECCRQIGVDVHGSFPVYEMFPCRVAINPEGQEVIVNRKRLQCLRPSKLASDIKAELDRLAKASFNAQDFVKELATAYDLALAKASRKKPCADDAPAYLSDLYNYLTPMKRFKRDYTKNNFAYDLARLYAIDGLALEDGRAPRFDTARDSKKSIRILDRHGAEQHITTIRFVKYQKFSEA